MERSTLAWFRAAVPDDSSPRDDTWVLVEALRSRYDIDVVTAAGAHDFVWKHFRRPYDLCIFELRSDRAHAFVPPYLVHYPGIVLLRGRPVGTGRILYRSRVVVTPHSAAVPTIEDEYPGVRVRYIPASVSSPGAWRGDEIVIDAAWPPTDDALTTALSGMAAGKPVIALESEYTADWPALNPQTWQPRGAGTPILVSIDPRDYDHSLKLAMQRLDADADLRARLGAAARDWFASHATRDYVVAAWASLIEEAKTLAPPEPPEGWKAVQDGTERAREILAEFGTTVDLF